MDILEAVAAIRSACPDMSAGLLEVPLRRADATGTRLHMSARHRAEGSSVTKLVRVNPRGGANGGATVTGEVRWSDAAGERLLCAAGPFTGLRTAAMSALATQVMADPAAARLVLFGAGEQAMAHARALCAVRPVTHITLFGRDAGRAAATTHRLAIELPGVSVALGGELASALAVADLVCCATTSVTPLFATGQLAESVHVTAVGSHRPGASELPADLLGAAPLVVVDDVEAAMAESGEVIDAVRSGLIRPSDLVGLPDWVCSNRRAPAGRTVFKSVGTAAYDWAIARALSAGSPTRAATPELALVGGDSS